MTKCALTPCPTLRFGVNTPGPAIPTHKTFGGGPWKWGWSDRSTVATGVGTGHSTQWTPTAVVFSRNLATTTSCNVPARFILGIEH